MEQQTDPTVQRRRLRVELRRARSEARLTQKQVADELGWSPSKLLRIENGQVGISQTDLRALLDHYGIADPETITTFIAMAQQGRRQQTWSQYRDVLYPEFMAYLSYESSASLLRRTEPLLVPGLLQTEEYARTVNQAFATKDLTERDVERQTDARMQRQSILDREDAPEMFFILDEAVVRRWVGATPGDARIMVRQLKHLQAVNENPRFSIQILPFRHGLHFGMQGSFTLLEFPDPEDDELLFLGTRATRESSEVIANYKDEFYQLESAAIARSALNEFLNSVIKEMN
ncbi:helix-turn-helix transcriptional regulator [Actinoplanes sp. NPDC051861]|uniref:helix-turn-helix domain-containing protein n=1 Tax=Actinoplanes sp. NPDC051861 TaxID=3155170 RepID=UPI00341FDCD1